MVQQYKTLLANFEPDALCLGEMIRQIELIGWHGICLVVISTHDFSGQHVSTNFMQRNHMKKIIIASAIAGIFAGQAAYAADAAPASDHAVSFNVGVTNDYRFRGISQTRMKPAVSAGADYTNTPTGLYVGTWGSNVEWLKDNTNDLSGANVELDLYGGKRGEINGISYDVGLIRYYYPSNKFHLSNYPSANTTEAYVQAGYGPFYIKYSQALTNFIGWAQNSDGSNYIDIGANIEVKDGYIANLHVGKQVVKGLTNLAGVSGTADYVDWKVGVTKDFGMAVVAVAVVGTDALDSSDGGYNLGGRGYLGGTAGIVTVSKSF